MKKETMKLFIRTMLVILSAALLTGAAACSKRPIQTGDVDQDLTVEELDIRGEVTFTENNTGGTEQDRLAAKAFISAFQKAYPNVKVRYEEAPVNGFDARISAGDIGDVFWGDASNMHNYQINHNALMPLDSYIKPLNIDLGQVFSGALEAGKVNGRLYMAPRNIGEHILIYNEEIPEAEGITFDKTVAMPWEDFKAICRTMTHFDEQSGRFTQVGASLKVWWHPIWQVFFRGFGGKWIDPKTHTVTIADSTEVMQGINELFDAINQGWLYPEDIAGSIGGELGEKFRGITNTYAQACFKNFGDLSWTTSYGLAYDSIEVRWDFCPFPALPTHTVSTGATGYLVYNRTRNPNAAAALALFFLTEPGQRAYNGQTGGNVPLLKSLAYDDFWHLQGTDWSDKNYDAFVSYPDETLPASVITQAPQDVANLFSTDAMQQLFIKVLSGSKSVETAFMELQTKANEKWSTIAN